METIVTELLFADDAATLSPNRESMEDSSLSV